ncbi:MAG: protein kinase [Myxococcales bacterium]|nr:protein kinase [Myxococcales bacterium]
MRPTVVLLVALVAGCGAHPVQLAICVSLAVLVILLVRQHVARRYAARQRAEIVASAEPAAPTTEPSRELGETVAQLATRPIQLVDEKVVDDRYIIIGRLGTGSGATVYEVERISDGQRLTMKLLRERADARRTARFAREARGMADPPHPNVVSVIDVGIVDGVTFIVTPIVDGGSLLAHEARFGDRAWAEWMLLQIATGLAALHARGVLHRDLRAANVLVSAGQAKLADVGVAALAAPTDGAEPPTLASDMFAFGALAQQLFGSEPLPEVLARCLADAPARRPSAAEAAAALAGR